MRLPSDNNFVDHKKIIGTTLPKMPESAQRF